MKNPTAWQKGTSGNPGGRPKLPDTTQRLRELSRVEAIEAVAQVMSMTKAQIELTATDDESPGALALAAAVMKQAIKLGCPVRASLMLSYVIGRPETAVPEAAEGDDQHSNTLTLAYKRSDLG